MNHKKIRPRFLPNVLSSHPFPRYQGYITAEIVDYVLDPSQDQGRMGQWRKQTIFFSELSLFWASKQPPPAWGEKPKMGN